MSVISTHYDLSRISVGHYKPSDLEFVLDPLAFFFEVERYL